MTAVLAKPLIFDPSSLIFSSFGGNASLVDTVEGFSGLGLQGLTNTGTVGLVSHDGNTLIALQNGGVDVKLGSGVQWNYLMGAFAAVTFVDSLSNQFLQISEDNSLLYFPNTGSFGDGISLLVGSEWTIVNQTWGVKIQTDAAPLELTADKILIDTTISHTPLVQLGGTASTNVALKPALDAFSVNTLFVRKADDSADARFQAASILASAQFGLIDSGTNLGLYGNQANKLLTVQSAYKVAFTNAASAAGGSEDVFLSRGAAGKLLLDDAGTHTPMLQFGGTTSSFYGLTGGAAPDGTNGILAVRADSISTLVAIGCTNVTTQTHGFLAVWNGSSGYDLILNGNGGSPYVGIASGGTLQWSSTAGATGSPDIVLSRVSAGLLGFNATLKNLVAGNETASASGGGATLPGNPVGFLSFVDSSGTTRKLPYYAV